VHCQASLHLVETTSSTASQVHHDIRDYFLSFGPIEEVTSFGYGEGPDIWWPDDRAWCVGYADLAATYVGGSSRCIDALLTYETLEAMPVSANDQVDSEADLINSDAA
jgi:hypothetical protein